jgi:predicted RNA-binding Zn-ribbon protein involved in translation (DUF1610 family)
MLPCNAVESKSLIYFPYWRFKGQLFACVPGGIHNRFIDVSQQALGSRYFPISVGLRSQALRLRFVTPETKGYFLDPIIPFDKILATFGDRFNRDLPKPILHQAHIGESVSLIYAPFYADRKIVDAVLDRPVSVTLPPEFDPMAFAGGIPHWRMNFIATLCPQCGWDLAGERESLVLACNNCGRVFMPRQCCLEKIAAAHLPWATICAQKVQEIYWLPFWRIKADLTGVHLKSYADLVRLANLPKVVQRRWDKIAFRFWSPAFKVRPRQYLQISTGVTVQQPRGKLEPQMPPGVAHPVTMPLKEAVEILTLILANFMRPREIMEETIADVGITPKGYLLVYIPFEVRHHEYVQPALNLAVNKNQLALADNL